MIACSIILFSPMPDTQPEVHRITFYDKTAHLVLFGVFTFLMIYFLETFGRINRKLACLLGFIAGSLFVFAGEYLQMVIPGRSPGILDFFAGMVGTLLAIIVFWLMFSKKRLLLHVCCATCAIHVQEILSKDFQVILYYYNPSIYPKKEYDKRLQDVKKVSRLKGLKLITAKYDHANWKKKTKGHEHDPEGGERCLICYQDRLERTAKQAKKEKIGYFTSTLTVSPHKKAEKINRIGQDAANKYQNLEFLNKNFKKNEGFKRSIELSKKHNFYRQNYCGCEYSKR